MAISLEKGQRIDLRKSSGSALTHFCVGVNWGAIETQGGFMGIGKKVTQVDIDLSCVLLDTNGNMADHIYSPLYRPDLLARFGMPPGKLEAAKGALRYSGDDRSGDVGGNDKLDNEVVTVDLPRVPESIAQIFFFINNCNQEDFSIIPYAQIRMFEGTPTSVKEVFASYNIASSPAYKGKRAIILGRLYRRGADWKFEAMGEATEDSFVAQTAQYIAQTYKSR